MYFSVRPYKIKKAAWEIQRIQKDLKSCEESVNDTISTIKALDGSYKDISHSISKTCTALESSVSLVKATGSSLLEISNLYEKNESEISHVIFDNIPDSKKKEVKGIGKKCFINDTNHKVEIIDPVYFETHLKGQVEEISRESVLVDMYDDIYKTITGDPGADEAQTRFTLNSQALAQYELLAFFADKLGINEKVLNGACITPEYLAYGVLIDGVPLLEYALAHPEEFYDDTTMLAQRDRNKARKAEENRKKQQKTA